jgi:outer membrane protein insertion porin family
MTLLWTWKQELILSGIYQEPLSIFFDKAAKTDPSTTPTDVAVFLSVKEKGRISAKTGTDLGNAEGSAYANVQWRNLFGGAETLDVNASLGTRTRSAYSAVFDTPVLSDPDFRWQIGGVQSSTQKSWASHEEVIKGGWTKVRWLSNSGSSHEVGYNGIWRQITGLASDASPTVRAEAGDSVKSSISYTWITDRRNNPSLPSSGYYMRTLAEIAGWGPLKGDVAFWKSEVETQTAVSIPIPGVKDDSGVSFTTGLRAGLLYPLTLGSSSSPEASHINDRFQLGGPTDVRGFRLSGLGPRDGANAVGGDVYAAGSANLFFPLPRVGADKPLRFQAFINGGQLLALKNPPKERGMSSKEVQKNVYDTIAELGNGLPSISAGVGLVYAHPVARFELNFSLPLVIRRGEQGRKGLQFGIGINSILYIAINHSPRVASHAIERRS